MKRAWDYIKAIETVLVLDACDLYDAVAKNESATCGMCDRRSAIEALAPKQALSWGNAAPRWVHSQALLGDVLTKSSAGLVGRMLRFLSTGQWRLVGDSMFTSARKRAAAGLDVLDKVESTDLGKESEATPVLWTLFGLLQSGAATLWGYVWSQ